MIDTFHIFPEDEGDVSTIRMRCVCGSEYPLSQSRACPACGRRVPKAVSIQGGLWKTYAEAKADALRRMLDSRRMHNFPADHREQARQNIEAQIRQLEDGTWKIEARRRMARLQDMLSANVETTNPTLAKLPEKDRQQMRKMLELGIQTAQQELEAAGETP
jgi:hypothetical protein